MNPVLQEILHNITTRLAALEESAQSDKLLIDLVQEQRAEIDRLRNQVAQPEQEPVAWLFKDMTWTPIREMGIDNFGTPVYAAPDIHTKQQKVCTSEERVYETQENEPEQEPVAWFVASKFENKQVCWFFDSQDDAMLWSAKNLKIGVIKPLYTAPPKREWVGLTEDERKHYNNRLSGSGVAEEIEAKLKERNGGN